MNTHIPSYGALQDTTTLTDICIRLQVQAAVAHVKGDRTTEMAAKNKRWELMYALQRMKAATPTIKHHHPKGSTARHNHTADSKPVATAVPVSKLKYLPVLQSDDSESQAIPIAQIAKKVFDRAKKCGFDFNDLLGDTLANIAEDKRDYSSVTKDPVYAMNKRVARALSKATYGMFTKDYCEHHSRERESLGDAYEKWTPRLTPVAVECYQFC